VGSFVVAGVVAFAVIVVMLGVYRYFTLLRARVQRAWDDVDTQLYRRHALVPTLVHAVRRYAPYDPVVLDTATSLNLTAMAVHREADAQALAEQALEHALQRVITAGNRHPELRVDEEFLALQQQLLEIETRIQERRGIYNSDARTFDRLVRTFPTVIIARMFGFAPEPYFELEPAVGHVPAPSIDLSPWT
jgi:LemA protein